jgi:N6-adenosine-specific RNA methylase IME4
MKFKVLAVDPPWVYKNKRTGGSMVSGADEKYNTLSLDELCNLSVKQIADKNSVLFLWVTTPLKYEIAQSGLVEKWGFKYVTTIYWRKIMSLGLGFQFRGQIEECWMCRRGSVRSFRTQFPNFIESDEVIQSKVRKHSQKPEEFFGMIEPSIEKFGLYPCLEIFARERRPLWMAIGNEISGNDIRVDLQNLIDDKLLACYYSGY